MRWPLRTQIFLPLGILILSVLVVVSGLNAYLAARRTSVQIEEQIATIAQSLQQTNYPLTDSILQQTRALSGAEFIVTDEGGQVLATSGPAPAALALPHGPGGGEQLGLLPTTEVLGQRYFHRVVRTQRGRSPAGQRVHILYPERVWTAARWQAAYPPLVVGAVALVIVFALSMTLAGRLSRPILDLRAEVGKIATGRFEPLPLPARDDELRDLIAAVNALVEDLVALRAAIQRSERLALLGQLSGGLAHHLRNAVAGAKLALQLHQRHCPARDPESLAVAERQLRLTEEHLQRLLTVGRPVAPQRVACRLADLLNDVAALVRPMCQHRRVSWQESPPPASLPDVWGDPAQLRQAVLDLVLNAIEAAAPDGWIRVACDTADGSQVLIRVLDSGPGLPAAIRERLFEPFATGKPEGIGLGLAAARQIAAAHGGHLRLAGEQPTCFELALPYGPLSETGDAATV